MSLVLCRPDGMIVAATLAWCQRLQLPNPLPADAHLRDWPVSAPLIAVLDAFCQQDSPGESAVAVTPALVHAQLAQAAYQIRPQWLGEFVMLDCQPQSQAQTTQMLAQIGQLTGRLVHDFKNQMGGLKLYATYLQKRLQVAQSELANGGALADCDEVVEKIVASLNQMAESSTLVGRLARPVELRSERNDLGGLLEHLVTGWQEQAAARQVDCTLSVDAALPECDFDSQQLRLALDTVWRRALRVSPANGVIRITAQAAIAHCCVTVTDHGPPLTDTQCRELFDLQAMQRLAPDTLELVYARQIAEAHGGQLNATLAPPGTKAMTEVRLTIPCVPLVS